LEEEHLVNRANLGSPNFGLGLELTNFHQAFSLRVPKGITQFFFPLFHSSWVTHKRASNGLRRAPNFRLGAQIRVPLGKGQFSFLINFWEKNYQGGLNFRVKGILFISIGGDFF